jgi:hypothetical protein
MLDAGAAPAAVAAFLGHQSPQTARRFSATLTVAPSPVPLTAKRPKRMAG